MIKLYDEIASVNNLGDVRYDRDQKYMSDKDKERARENIGLGDLVTKNIEEALFANLPIAQHTLRFSFSDRTYDPIEAGVGMGSTTPSRAGGTWKKLKTSVSNIWDWTSTSSTDWHTAFGGGSVTADGAFADENNTVYVIASDTVGVQNMSRLFQNCYAFEGVHPEFSTSDATNIFLLFSGCHAMTKYPIVIDASNCTGAYTNNALFQNNWSMRTAPNYIPPSGTLWGADMMFSGCTSLTGGYENWDMSRCNSLYGTFSEAISITVPPDNWNTSEVTSFNQTFGPTTTDWTGTMGLTHVPHWDYSKATNIQTIFECCRKIKEIPAYFTESLPTTGITKVQKAFSNCESVSTGQVALYYKLKDMASITGAHDKVFTNCGINNERGRIENSMIPISWGGTFE